MLLILWVAIGFATTAQCAIDNAGTEFMLCYMNNYITSGSSSYDIEIYVTTVSNNDVYVNVTTPLYDANFLEQTVVQRGGIKMIYVPAAIRGSDTGVADLGVYVTASEEITVYSVNKQLYSTDGFIGFPIDALGTDYIAVTWDVVPEVMVVGVTDNTDVTFTLGTPFTNYISYNGYHYGGDSFTVTLNRYQTFHMYSSSGDLSNTLINASNPVAVFSGNYKTIVADTNTDTSSDHLVEQAIPTQSLGKEFVSFPSPDRNQGDYMRVIAAEDDTTYSVGGVTHTISDRKYYDTHNLPSDEYHWVTSDKAIVVVMYTKTIGVTGTNDGLLGGDPAMSVCVPVALYGSDYTWSTVTTTEGNFTNYIILVSHKDYVDDLVLDNENITNSWTEVIGNTDYLGVAVTVSPGAHTIYNRIPAHPFLGIAYGNAEYNSYAYASGLRLSAVNLPCTPTSTVAGDGEDNDCDGLIDEETDNGIDDDGDGSIDEDLAVQARTDGGWGAWESWGNCSVSCANGTNIRTRACDDPAPANNGLDCVGSSSETGSCYMGPCPIDGEWGAWGAWGSCPVTCGTGLQLRNRSCDDPEPQYGGDDCNGTDTDTNQCIVSAYCLPSFYGNTDLGCGNLSFACGTGSIQCIDLSFRCDGTVDCDDGTDESLYFTGCSVTCSKNKNAAGHVVGDAIMVALTLLLSMDTARRLL